MNKKAIFILGLIFVFSTFVLAQTKTVTNADLEKFRQKRLSAEKDLRENYAKLGFPSPKEMEHQNEKSRREFSEFSNRLRQQQIARQNSQPTKVIYYYQDHRNNRNNLNRRTGFINYNRYFRGYFYNPNRHRRYRNNGNRRFKPNRGYRNRFNPAQRNRRSTQINPRFRRR